LTKSRPLGAKLYHADRRTDMKKLVVDFCNIANSWIPLGNFCWCSWWH